MLSAIMGRRTIETSLLTCAIVVSGFAHSRLESDPAPHPDACYWSAESDDTKHTASDFALLIAGAKEVVALPAPRETLAESSGDFSRSAELSIFHLRGPPHGPQRG